MAASASRLVQVEGGLPSTRDGGRGKGVGWGSIVDLHCGDGGWGCRDRGSLESGWALLIGFRVREGRFPRCPRWVFGLQNFSHSELVDLWGGGWRGWLGD